MAQKKSSWGCALSLEESNHLKCKKAPCEQGIGQERSVWADTPRELNLGGDVGEAETGRTVGEDQRGEQREQDEDRRMSWAYLYEPK